MPTLTYLSHSCFLVTTAEHIIIIDPFITGNPTSPVSADELAPDFIVLTHAHGDHIGDAIALAKKHNALIIAVNELANHAIAMGCRAHNMHIGGAHTFPFGRLKFTIAHHGSSTSEGQYMGEPAGVLITAEGKTIYHCGDTGLFLDMKLIGEMNTVDCMLAPIGDNFTMGIDDAVKAVEFVDPALVVPMHYNTFPIIEADPEEFFLKVANSGRKARILKYGESMTL